MSMEVRRRDVIEAGALTLVLVVLVVVLVLASMGH
jgi:hypothetical protein